MTKRIEPSDIEAKLRQIRSEIDDTAAAAIPAAAGVGIAIAVGVTAVAYTIGSRSARKRTTIVEVRRA